MFETEDEYTRRKSKENVHLTNASLRRDAADRARADKADRADFRFGVLSDLVMAGAWGIGKFRNRQVAAPKVQPATSQAPGPQPSAGTQSGSFAPSAADSGQPTLFDIEGDAPRQPVAAAGAPKAVNVLAIVSLVVSLVLYFLEPLSSIAAIVLGILALRAIEEARGREVDLGGRGLAIAGIIIGAITGAIWVLARLTGVLVFVVDHLLH